MNKEITERLIVDMNEIKLDVDYVKRASNKERGKFDKILEILSSIEL